MYGDIPGVLQLVRSECGGEGLPKSLSELQLCVGNREGVDERAQSPHHCRGDILHLLPVNYNISVLYIEVFIL